MWLYVVERGCLRMKKKIVLKLSDTRFIEVEGELIYADAEVGKNLPKVFSA
jgi:hypothetical protein